MCKRISNMKVYISGKIGEEVVSEAIRQKFAKAKEMLKAKGYEVFNPCDERWQNTLRRDYEKEKLSPGSLLLQGKFPTFYAYVLLRDLMVLSTKDAVYFLDDWGVSPGARAEYYTARAISKRMFFEDRCDACEYLIQRMYDELNAEGKTLEYDGVQDCNDLEIAYFTKHLEEAWLPTAGKEGGV